MISHTAYKDVTGASTVDTSTAGTYDVTYETVLFTPYKYSKGGTVSMMMLLFRIFSCVTLAANPVEFVTKMSNVRLPFVSRRLLYHQMYDL